MHNRRAAVVLSWLLWAGAAVPAWSADAPAADFNRQIRPILSNNCFKCHGPDAAERKSGLRLDLADAALAPAESGSVAIVPGKPDQSELVARITSADPDYQMPPPDSQKKLTEQDKALLRVWIEEGASYRQHWSLVALIRPALPVVKNASWPRNPVDYFILAKLDSAGLAPSPEADRETLLRRVCLDLTGLPPTPAQIDALLADDRPDAYERLVDDLLQSPAYGERLALDWLDAARYADTHGYHIDSGREMSRWRDWVIRSFNDNRPYDEFTVEQLAGDLLPDATLDQKIASGFNRNHMINFEGGAIPKEYHTAYIIDRVNTTATVWLGLTVACSQCHDHKYDPLTQREFYQLFAYFHNVRENGLDGNKGNAEPAVKAPTADEQAQLDALAAQMRPLELRLEGDWPEADAAQAQWERQALANPQEGAPPDKRLPDEVAKALAVTAAERSNEQATALRTYFRTQVSEVTRGVREELASRVASRAALEASIPTAMVMNEGEPRQSFVLVRGQYDKESEPVGPGVPACLPPMAEDAPKNRLGLARWLVRRDHPLTARVTVNRYWQLLFGVGLVKTAEDFGSQGDAPSHQDLLDWLAVEFQEPMASPPVAGAARWNVKALLRLLVTSATYRQSSRWRAELAAPDPENRLLGRASRLRLPAELIRDQALLASGLLDRRIGGASVSPYQPAGLWEELMSREDGKNWTAQSYVQSHGPDLYRRTMYTFWKRTSPPPTLSTFDAPDRETCTVRRARTNTPLQALILLNDPTYVEAARKLAERAMQTSSAPAARIEFAYRAVLGRQPRPAETAVLVELAGRQHERFRAQPASVKELLGIGEAAAVESLDAAELAAWTMVASAILNLDEAVTRG